MKIKITDKNGLVLKTADKLCKDDIIVIPDKSILGGGGASLNIAYGDTAPEDTTKLWVNGAEPSKVIASNKMNGSMTTTADTTNLAFGSWALTVLVNGVIYYTNVNYVKTLKRYDLINKVELSDLPNFTTLTTFLPQHVFNKGKKIYVLGVKDNSGGVSELHIYDIDTNTWTQGAIPTYNYICHTSSIIVGEYFYVVGGAPKYANYGTGNTGRYVQRYSFLNDTWQTMSSLPATNHKTAIASFDNQYIYVFGGKTDYADSTTTNKIFKYNINANTWSTLSTTLLVATSKFSAIKIGENIYLLGGSQYANSTVTTTDKIYAFNVASETLIETNYTLNTAACNYGCVVNGNNVYLLGGSTGTNSNTSISYLWQTLTLEQPLPTNQLLINTTLNKNLFKIINAPSAEIEIGVNGVYRGNANGVAELESANVFDESQSAWVDVQSGAVVQKVSNGLINFTIDGVTYETEDGMTWYEWCNSAYNIDGAYCDNNESNVMAPSQMFVLDNTSSFVYGNDTIIADYAYISGGF